MLVNTFKLIGKYMDIFEPKYGVFKTSDYYKLDLEERRKKYMNYDNILCEECSDDIYIKDCYCTTCYDKETGLAKKGHMKFGPKFGIFKTSDYNLDLEERRIKYKDSDGILCEKCSKDIYIEDCYCTSCYDKETDLVKKGHMKFGPKFGIFKTSDYNLDLEERIIKYKDFDGILCEKCSKDIYIEDCYCTSCYDKETDLVKKGHMKFGPKFGIFKTSDYNLDLEERRKKYMNYDNILCEKCSNDIYIENCYCTTCYDKETDPVKIYMKFGPKFGIFKTSDYNLDLEERRKKYMNYDNILCEECSNEISMQRKWNHHNEEINFIERVYMKYENENENEKYNNEIDEWNYYCTYCYNKETDIIKKGHMKFGSNFRILDYNLNLEERRAKYMNFDGILCEKCNQEINNHYYYCMSCHNKETDIIKKDHMRSKFAIFKKSDYNLNLEEIRAKYMNYDGILCENCNQEIEEYYYYCRYCYYKETDVIKKGHRCKVCFIRNNDDCCSFYEFKQYLENFSKWISENKFIYNYLIKEQKGEVSDYDLDEDDRLVKYKDFDYILCEKCGIKYHCNYCYDCYIKEINELNELKSELQPNLQDYENFYFKIYNKETKELKELKELQSILKNYEDVYFKSDDDLGIFRQISQLFENTKDLTL
ncbi:unnamed protein product [Rhizophagus irregularis]|nr:unnamed protein product [Rhizophagus irregularis]